MTPETFFEHFALLADAPNGVQKLREMILQLAVQGKLVPQDPNDEPADVLLEKIKAKKERLLARGTGKKTRSLMNPRVDDDLPTTAPKGWSWIRLRNLIFSITGGGTPSKNNPEYWDGEIPWASVKDLKTKYLEKTIDSISTKGLNESSTNLIPAGRIIVCTRMGLGKITLNTVDIAINQDLKALELPVEVDKEYFYNFYLTQDISGAGMTVSGIRQDDLLGLWVPLPPLAEQHRIVAKVDQLMALCDELEAHQQKRNESRTRLSTAAIDKLLTAREPDEFAAHWQRICNHFDLLSDTPESIGQLRQAILQLAVQGKLVPQDPNDEPADVLLEKIRTESDSLVNGGKKNGAKPLPPIDQDSIAFSLPGSWEWVHLSDLLTFGPRNGYSPKPTKHTTDVKSLTLSATTSGTFDDRHFKYIDEEMAADSYLWLKENDILIQRGNSLQYVGVAAVYRGKSDEFIYPDLMMKIRASRYVDASYLHLVINSEDSRNFLRERATGTSGSMPKINKTTVSSLPVPVPPLAEQHRIVAKVDQLMTLCDTLEAKLKQSQTDSDHLMDAMVQNVLVA